MPSSRSAGLPTTHPSFLRHRYHDNSRQLPSKIDLSIPTPLPAWASLPTPPMSGTPPPDQSSDPSQLAGRRRKREDTPTATSQEQSQVATSSIDISPLIEQTAQRYGDSARYGRTTDPSMLPSPLTLPWEQAPSYVAGGGQGYALVTSNMPPRAAPVSPRATRKVKAHVASACVNCKRKHLRCDETRPCRRCVQSGKEDTCVDVEHKKRGRPPLRDPNTEAARASQSGNAMPSLGSSSGRAGQNPSLVPILPTPTPSRMHYAPTYAAPSVAQSSIQAQAQFDGSQRPASFPQARQAVPNITQISAGHQGAPYAYLNQAHASTGYPAQDYTTPLWPRRHVPSQTTTNPTASNYGAPPFQLPPIRPAPPGTNMDPALAQQQRHLQPQGIMFGQPTFSNTSITQPPATSEERSAKRPKMDMRNILSPRE